MNELLSRKHVVVRKECKCSGCLRVFPVGSKLLKTTLVDDDGIYTWVECATCEMISAQIFDEVPPTDICDGITSYDYDEWVKTRYGSWEKADLAVKEDAS